MTSNRPKNEPPSLEYGPRYPHGKRPQPHRSNPDDDNGESPSRLIVWLWGLPLGLLIAVIVFKATQS